MFCREGFLKSFPHHRHIQKGSSLCDTSEASKEIYSWVDMETINKDLLPVISTSVSQKLCEKQKPHNTFKQ